MTLEFKSNADKVVRNLNSKSRKVAATARDLLDEMGREWEREMVVGRFTGYYNGKTTGNKLRNRSGNLRSSINSKPVGGTNLSKMGVLLMAGSGAAGYARLQETGQPKPIRPKRRKYLRIPLKAAMTGAGVVRPENKPIKSGNGWKTVGGKDTFVRETNGKAIVYRKDGRDKITPLFLLKGSVVVKPRLGMEKTLKKVMRKNAPNIASAIAATLGRRA